MEIAQNTGENNTVDRMFKAGAHFGFSKSRRHPSSAPFIFGVKNNVEIFDLAQTESKLTAAKEFVKKLGVEGKTLVFVSGKNEAMGAVRSAAESLGVPYIAGRWIGGTITNFGEIRSRVEKLLDLQQKREKGELAKYTKKERLLIDREIAKLELLFTGLIPLKSLPHALFVIDPRREHIAVREAKRGKIPVVALCGSDCNVNEITYPIPANDGSMASIKFFVEEIAAAYKEGKGQAVSV